MAENKGFPQKKDSLLCKQKAVFFIPLALRG